MGVFLAFLTKIVLMGVGVGFIGNILLLKKFQREQDPWACFERFLDNTITPEIQPRRMRRYQKFRQQFREYATHMRNEWPLPHHLRNGTRFARQRKAFAARLRKEATNR